MTAAYVFIFRIASHPSSKNLGAPAGDTQADLPLPGGAGVRTRPVSRGFQLAPPPSAFLMNA